MTWTEQKIQMLKDMWGNGYSASEIANRLGDITRNAVIGKAHRMKLSAGPVASGAKRVSGTVAPPTGILKAKTTASMKSPRKTSMLRSLPNVPAPTSTASYTREHYNPSDAFKKKGEGIAVTKAGERHCRWPVGDPRSPEFRFCGCNAHDGLPYCLDHARVAYQNLGRKSRSVMNEPAERERHDDMMG